MKIGIDLRSLGDGALHRGIGTYVYNLLWSLSEIDKINRYYLFAYSGQSDYLLHNFPHTENFNFIFLHDPKLRKKRFIRFFFVKNPVLDVREYSIDVIYQLDTIFPVRPGVVPRITIVYDLIPQLFKKQYMHLNLNLSNIFGPLVFLREAYKFKLEDKLLQTHKQATKVISISENSKKDLVNLVSVSPSKIEPILLGADKREKDIGIKVTPANIKKYSKKPFFLYVGGADPRKGLLSLIDDFYELSKSNDVNLIIAGKEIIDIKVPGAIKIQNKVKHLGLESKVILPGFISDSDLAALYSSAVAFIFPSRYEGFGLPILEAMQEHCPVITYNNSSIPEVAGKATLMVRDGEPLTSAMQELLNSKTLRQKLIEQGLAQSKKFTWHKTAKETLRLFKSTAKG